MPNDPSNSCPRAQPRRTTRYPTSRVTSPLCGSASASTMEKMVLPGQVSVRDVGAPARSQASARRRVWRISSGRSAAPTTAWIAMSGAGQRRAGLSAVSLGLGRGEDVVHPRQEQGRRSWMPLIDSTRSITCRDGGGQGAPLQAMRATRCPPAECPARRTGPAISPAAAADGRGDCRDDRLDTDLGCLRVARHRDGPAPRPRALSEMGEIAPVHPLPVAAMDENDEALRRALGVKQVEARPRDVAIGNAGLGPGPEKVAPFRGPRRPEIVQRIAPRHVGGVVEGVRPVDGVGSAGHAARAFMNIGPPRQRGKPKPLTITTSMASGEAAMPSARIASPSSCMTDRMRAMIAPAS
jgi:hypothetical protein